jgi:predicted nucleic acid-binding protein
MTWLLFDTSAIYALADRKDPNHEVAVERLERLQRQNYRFFLHSYLVAEAAALLQRRLGLEATLRFLGDAGSMRIHWVTARDHREAVALLAARGKRELSLADCMSFVLMRRYGIAVAFAFDDDFPREGFSLLD